MREELTSIRQAIEMMQQEVERVLSTARRKKREAEVLLSEAGELEAAGYRMHDRLQEMLGMLDRQEASP